MGLTCAECVPFHSHPPLLTLHPLTHPLQHTATHTHSHTHYHSYPTHPHPPPSSPLAIHIRPHPTTPHASYIHSPLIAPPPQLPLHHSRQVSCDCVDLHPTESQAHHSHSLITPPPPPYPFPSRWRVITSMCIQPSLARSSFTKRSTLSQDSTAHSSVKPPQATPT
jgi:hypothetical protein